MEREMMKAAALNALMENLAVLVELDAVPREKAREMLAAVVAPSAKVIGFRLNAVKPGAGGVIGAAL